MGESVAISEGLRKRLRKDRPKVTIRVAVPEDVATELEEVAKRLGYASSSALIRAYIGRGLRRDLRKKTPEEWQSARNYPYIIVDPDGWRGSLPGLPALDWSVPITEAEFRERARMSTVMPKKKDHRP